MSSKALECWNEAGEPIGVRLVSNGIVVGESDGDPEGYLVPGFIDLHIHGAYGVDFMTASSEDLVETSEKLAAAGVEGWLPTTITASAQDVAAALAQLPEHPSVLGFHLEGPFISPEFPGAQPKGAILDPAARGSEWDPILEDSRMRVITMAPERPGALELASRLAARGVRVSMGHTAATYQQAMAGVEAGFCHATHTYNAMKGLHHREPGALGCVLSEPRVLAELIYDRVHVHPAAAKTLISAKGLDGVVGISDGTMASGMPPGTEFEVWGHKVYSADGEVRLRENNALAGSAITLADGFTRLAQDFGIQTAVCLCSVNPRKALRLPQRPRIWVELDSVFQVIRAWPC